MKKEEIVNLAYEKGFRSLNDWDVFDSTKPDDYFLWLLELNKWLTKHFGVPSDNLRESSSQSELVDNTEDRLYDTLKEVY